MKLFFFLTFFLCAALNGHQTIENFEIEQEVDSLLLLVQKRLVIMHEVAKVKWNQNLPIEDKNREQQILTEFANKAHQYDLDDTLVTKFFQAQIEASKEIQKQDFILWKKKGIIKFEKIFCLKDEIRNYIDLLNHEMLFLLSKIYSRPSSEFHNFILDHPISKRRSDSIEDKVWSLAVAPLKKGA